MAACPQHLDSIKRAVDAGVTLINRASAARGPWAQEGRSWP
jgi:hypothetical protein